MKRETASASPAPDDFDLAKNNGAEDAHVKDQDVSTHEQISAADYDPNLDRREDERKWVRGVQDDQINSVEEIEEIEVDEGDDDDDEVDDMFAALTSEKKPKRVKKVVVRAAHS